MTGDLEATGLGPYSKSLTTTKIGHRLAVLVFPMAAIVFAGAARGGIVAQYAFTDVTAGVLNRSATTVAANATAGNITDAPIVNTHPMVVLSRTGGNTYGVAAGPVLSANRAAFNESNTAANVYFTFNVSANTGNVLNLSNLTFNVGAGGGAAGDRSYDIRTSLDFGTSLTGSTPINTIRPNFTAVSIDLSGAQFQNLSSPLTFQFRFFTPGFSQNIDFDDITLNGTVASTAVPESSTLPVLAIAGAWMIRCRQRKA